MSTIPVKERFPLEMLHVQEDLQFKSDNTPRFEPGWYGALTAVFCYVFSPATPARYYVRPQYWFRYPLSGGALPADHEDGEDLPESARDLANTSIDSSHNFVVKGRAPGEGKEEGVLIPDFMIDRAIGNRSRSFVLLVEVKKCWDDVTGDDLAQIQRYAARILRVHQAGGRAEGTALMLIGGHRVYTWQFRQLSSLIKLTMTTLRKRAWKPVHSRGFLDELTRIKESADHQV